MCARTCVLKAIMFVNSHLFTNGIVLIGYVIKKGNNSSKLKEELSILIILRHFVNSVGQIVQSCNCAGQGRVHLILLEIFLLRFSFFVVTSCWPTSSFLQTDAKKHGKQQVCMNS